MNQNYRLGSAVWKAICAVENLHLTDEQLKRMANGRAAVLAHYKNDKKKLRSRSFAWNFNGVKMTTRVDITNHGPSTVKIEVQGRDEHGHFTAVDEKTIESGRFAEVYIHEHQSFQVSEVKE